MKYVEFTVHTTDEAEELVSDVLWNYQEYGVSVSSVKDVIELTEKRRETYDYLDIIFKTIKLIFSFGNE